MSLGYTQPLYLLPFDHRQSYVTGMFHYTAPLTAEQHSKVADSKRLIYEGFTQSIGADLPPRSAGILVDEEFGADILRDATASGYVTALSTERAGPTSLNSNTGAHSPNTSKPLSRPSRRFWCATTRKTMLRSIVAKRPG